MPRMVRWAEVGSESARCDSGRLLQDPSQRWQWLGMWQGQGAARTAMASCREGLQGAEETGWGREIVGARAGQWPGGSPSRGAGGAEGGAPAAG
jgi:hypothetical protein